MNFTFLLVAVVYFAAIWFWRRFATPLPWRIAVFFYALVLALLFKPMVLAYANVPGDFLYTLYPWAGTGLQLKPANSEINDVILQMVPWAHQVREAWLGFSVPVWNAAAGGGYPLIPNGQSAPFSIFRILSLPLPLAHSFTSEAAMKLLVALTFAYLYMKRHLASEVAAVATAVSFGFSTFLIVWLHFPHASVAAFTPATFYAVDLLFERFSYKRFVLASGVFTALLLNGHPESAAHIVFAASLYTLFKIASAKERRIAAVTALVGAGLVALLLAQPFVLPFANFMNESQRFQKLAEYHTPTIRTDFRFLVPFYQVDFYGLEKDKNIWGPGIAETASGFAGILGIAGWFAMAAHLARRREWNHISTAYVAMTALLGSIALGIPWISDLFHKLPLYSLAANGRLRLVICWCVAALAGFMIDLAVRRKERVAPIIGIVAAAIALALPFFLNNFPSTAAFDHAWVTSIPAVLVLIAAAVVVATKSRRGVAPLLLIAAIGVELFRFGVRWNPVIPDWMVFPKTPLIEKLQRLQNEPAPDEILPFRIGGKTSTLFPNSSAMYGFEDIRAHDPMANGKLLGTLRVLAGYTSQDYFGMLSDFSHPVLDYANVRYAVCGPGESIDGEGWERVYEGTDGGIFKNHRALPRFFSARNIFNIWDDEQRLKMVVANEDWLHNVYVKQLPSKQYDTIREDFFRPRPDNAPEAAVRIVSYKPTRIRLTVDAPRWSLVTSSQPDLEGWRIYRAGKRLARVNVNEVFFGFIVPPGHSEIDVIYSPRPVYQGLAIAITTILALIAAGVLSRLGILSGDRFPRAKRLLLRW